MKRFYGEVAVVPEADGNHVVRLDGRPVLTPRRRRPPLPTRALAEAVAAEWRSQGERIVPLSMPLLRLVNTAADRLADHRDYAVATLAGYGATDLVCYRAAVPVDLAVAQAAAWDPVLDWLAARHGARLAVTTGLAAVAQPAAALQRLRLAVDAQDDLRLAALHEAVTSTGSLALGLGLLDRALDVEAAWRAALVDELHQEARWGTDAEAEWRRAAIRSDLEQSVRLLALLDGSA